AAPDQDEVGGGRVLGKLVLRHPVAERCTNLDAGGTHALDRTGHVEERGGFERDAVGAGSCELSELTVRDMNVDDAVEAMHDGSEQRNRITHVPTLVRTSVQMKEFAASSHERLHGVLEGPGVQGVDRGLDLDRADPAVPAHP